MLTVVVITAALTSACRVADGTSTAEPTPLPRPFPDATAVAGALPGSGVLRDGPFVFYAALYQDSRMKSREEAQAAWLASDVAGIGVRVLWRYEGAELAGPISEAWGPEGHVQEVSRWPALRPGNQGGRAEGGLLLAPGAGPGRRTWFGLRLGTPEGSYGVRVEFTLVARRDALAASDIAVVPLRP